MFDIHPSLSVLFPKFPSAFFFFSFLLLLTLFTPLSLGEKTVGGGPFAFFPFFSLPFLRLSFFPLGRLAPLGRGTPDRIMRKTKDEACIVSVNTVVSVWMVQYGTYDTSS